MINKKKALAATAALVIYASNLSGVSARAESVTSITATNAVSEEINLTIGSSGEKVKEVQKYLFDLGFYTGQLDGEYDLNTARGTVRFQISKGIYAHGRVDTNTYSALVSEYNNVSLSGTSNSLAADEERIDLTIGSTGELVTKVQNYLSSLGFYTGQADGVYGLDTARGTVKFQRLKGIYANGKVDTNTYNAMLKESQERTRLAVSRGGALSGSAVAYDWFKDVNKRLFPIGSVAKVTDVYTRKSFTVKRTYGYNHADSEALTLEDTNIIKSIWGGFSWERRPVVVEVNGYRIAASMTAMPHAGLDKYAASAIVNGRSGGYGRGSNLDAVKGNGMDGHIDIHFLNSRTHGTNRVDSKHQAAIRQAVGR